MADKLQKALQYLSEKHNAEWCSEYGEPGYTNPVEGVILANWNDIPKGLAKWLEKCGFELEWPDEWWLDHNHGKAYRTNADSYWWESSIMIPPESYEYITPDDGADTWIEACAMTANGQPVYCLPSWIAAYDITAQGFTLKDTDLESGFHPGQTDDPKAIAKKLFEDGAYRVVFQKVENSQFYCRFSVWVDIGEDARDFEHHAARAFFASAWADAVEENGASLRGEIMHQMPDVIDPAAVNAAQKLRTQIESLNAKSISDLIGQIERDGDGDRDNTVEHFGHYAAMQAMGHGVGLYDAFGSEIHSAIKVPYLEFSSLNLSKGYTV